MSAPERKQLAEAASTKTLDDKLWVVMNAEKPIGLTRMATLYYLNHLDELGSLKPMFDIPEDVVKGNYTEQFPEQSEFLAILYHTLLLKALETSDETLFGKSFEEKWDISAETQPVMKKLGDVLGANIKRATGQKVEEALLEELRSVKFPEKPEASGASGTSGASSASSGAKDPTSFAYTHTGGTFSPIPHAANTCFVASLVQLLRNIAPLYDDKGPFHVEKPFVPSNDGAEFLKFLHPTLEILQKDEFKALFTKTVQSVLEKHKMKYGEEQEPSELLMKIMDAKKELWDVIRYSFTDTSTLYANEKALEDESCKKHTVVNTNDEGYIVQVQFNASKTDLKLADCFSNTQTNVYDNKDNILNLSSKYSADPVKISEVAECLKKVGCTVKDTSVVTIGATCNLKQTTQRVYDIKSDYILLYFPINEITFPVLQTLSLDFSPVSLNGVEYGPISVIYHSGSSFNEGHYYTYTKSSDGKLYKYDDMGDGGNGSVEEIKEFVTKNTKDRQISMILCKKVAKATGT
jgi:hypothetical protein